MRIYMLSKYKKQRLLDEAWVIQTLNELMSGNMTNGSKLKKLSGFVEAVYSIRGTIKARIVFTYGVYQGELSIFLLDILPNHDIPKNNTYDDQVRTVKKMMFGEALPSDEPDTKEILSAITTVEPVPVYEFNCSGIILSEEQNNLITAKLPLLVNGPPGSGKTSTLFIILSRMVEQGDTGLPQRYLYIARSKALAHFMSDEWQKSGCGQRAKGMNITVEFKYAHCAYYQDVDDNFLYKSVVDNKKLEHALDSKARTPLTLSRVDTRAWFDQRLKELKKLSEIDRNIQIDFESFLQEKDIICGYSRETYLAGEFGKRNSLFDPSQKKLVYDLYKDYLLYVDNQMKNNKLFDLNLCTIQSGNVLDKEKAYDVVLVDETQDFSLCQLQDLKKLSRSNQIVMSIDTNQDLEKGLSLRTHIKGLFTVNGTCFIKSHSLVKSFRCPELVIELANCLITLKNKITGGVADKEEYSSFQHQSTVKDKGDVLFVNSQSLQQSKELLSRFKDTEIAVVAYADKKEEAQKIFKNYTVFTPEDIKGLEYKCVITYQLFDTAFFKEANKALKTLPEKSPVYRAKPDEARPLFAPCFNGVFTAFTRAQNALVIMQDKLSGLEHLISPIKDIVDKANQKTPLSINTKTITQSVKTTTEDWKKHVDDLLYQGKNQVAEDVFNQRLKATLLLSFEEYQKKKNAPLAKSPVEIIHKNNLPNKELSKKPQIEIKPSTKSSRQINKQNQSIQSMNKKKNTELLSTKPSYLLNHFTESFLELFLNHENLCQYRTLPLPQFNNQTFLDVIISDKNKRQVLEQLLTKKPFLFRRFFSEIELVNIEFFQYIQHQDCFDEIMFKRYCTDLNNLLNKFSYPGFMVNHIVTLRSRTLLAIAIEAKIEECVNFLINIKGIDVNKELYIDGRTPLLCAIQSGNLNIVNLLLNIKEIDVNKSDKKGLTPLLVAVNRNNINMVNALLKSTGIDINKASEDDLTPLSIAASDDQNIDVLNVLIKMKGIDIEDLSPLFVAVEMGQKKSSRALLNFFDPDARVLEQVWMFAKKNHSDERIIELLECKLNSVNLKNESNIKVFNESGFSVLFFKQTTNEIEETECEHSSKPTSGKKT